jgi:4-carboxymuconolactone decarboxylase
MRFAALTPTSWTDQQAALANDIAGGPRASGPFRLVEADGSLTGPFGLMLLQPVVGRALSELGASLRYEGTLSPRERELAILAVGAERRNDYEWYAHEAVARQIGMTDEELEAIRRGDLVDLSSREAAVLAAARRLAHRDELDADVYEVLVAELEPSGVAELVIMVGYYMTLAKLMAVFEVGVPIGEPPPKWT